MKNSKKNFSSVGQNTTEVKASRKHDANVQKNSTLYFQIGLILCLLGTYALFEMQFQDKVIVPQTLENNEVAIIDLAPPKYRVEVIQKKQTEPKKVPSTKLIDVYKEVPNDKEVVAKEIFTSEDPEPTTEDFNLETLPDDGDLEKDDLVVPFVSIEKVPVYPGCERKKTNEEKRKCMSNKIAKLVSKSFNTGIGDDMGLRGKQKIHTQFTVNKNGEITDIKIRAPHPELEKEAKRVINKIPKMQPGFQQNKPVGVIYNLPINFLVRN